jgi:hypothetical protein
MFQEIRDVMTNKTPEFSVITKFPYHVIGGSALAGSIQGVITAVEEVWRSVMFDHAMLCGQTRNEGLLSKAGSPAKIFGFYIWKCAEIHQS